MASVDKQEVYKGMTVIARMHNVAEQSIYIRTRHPAEEH